MDSGVKSAQAWGIAALLFGATSFCLMGLTSLPAIICGIVAASMSKGRRGWVGMALGVAGVLVHLASVATMVGMHADRAVGWLVVWAIIVAIGVAVYQLYERPSPAAQVGETTGEGEGEH